MIRKPESVSEVKHKAAELSFDLSKQFLSIAFAGVAFALGVSASDSQVFSMWEFWVAICFFGLSSVLGFLFMMNGTAHYANGDEFDVYGGVPRFFSGLQILLVGAGVLMLLCLHMQVKGKPADVKCAKVRVELDDQVVEVPQLGGLVDISLSKDGDLRVISSGSDKVVVDSAAGSALKVKPVSDKKLKFSEPVVPKK